MEIKVITAVVVVFGGLIYAHGKIQNKIVESCKTQIAALQAK